MSVPLTKIQQVKIPVSDLQRSVDWYRGLLGLTLYREFVEEGVLAGVTLVDLDHGLLIGLRWRAAVPGEPSLAGFDVVALGVESVSALHQVAQHCRQVGIDSGTIVDRGPDGSHLDVPDPDGTVIRFLSPLDFEALPFGGVEFGPDGAPSFYYTPRLRTS